MSLLSQGILAGALTQVSSAAYAQAVTGTSSLIQTGTNALSNLFNPLNTARSMITPSSGGNFNGDNNRFMSIIRQSGVMRTNLFFVSIVAPQKIRNKNQELITYLAESVNLPGVNLGTIQNRRHGFGSVQKYANDVSFNDITVSFICDAGGKMMATFNEWMNKIVRFDNLSNQVSVGQGLNPFFFEYKDNYIAPQFTISVVDETRQKIVMYDILEAFPTQVSDISMNWGANDELARFTVNFSYTTWKKTIYNSIQSPQPTTPGTSLLNMSFSSTGVSMSLTPSLGSISSRFSSINLAGGSVVNQDSTRDSESS